MKYDVIPFHCLLPDKSPVSTCGGDIFSQCFEAVLKAPLGVKVYEMFDLTSIIHFEELCLVSAYTNK